MITFETLNAEPLKGLRAWLDSVGFDSMLRAMRGSSYFTDPWPHALQELVAKIARLPEPERVGLELFTIGWPIERERAHRVLGRVLTDELTTLGLLCSDGDGIQADHYSIIPFLGRTFIASRPSADGPDRIVNVYLGRDSFSLAHAIERTAGPRRVLDLCSGSGILGQVAARSSRVVAVERNEEAIAVSRANAVLNDVSSTWEVRHGDLFDPVDGEQFDLVLCNPPFVAVPDATSFPAFGRGGPDGLQVVREIFDGLPRVLGPTGRARIILENPGPAREPTVLPLLETFCARHPTWSVRALETNCIRLTSENAFSIGRTVGFVEGDRTIARALSLSRELLRSYRALGFDYIHVLELTVDCGGASGLRFVSLVDPWEPSSVPSFRNEVSSRERVVYEWRARGGPTVELDDVDHNLAAAFDGQRSIEEAARMSHSATDDRAVARGIRLAARLASVGILDFDASGRPIATVSKTDGLVLDLLDAMKRVRDQRRARPEANAKKQTEPD